MTGIMILDHISIVVAALLCAIVVGVPLGILSYFYPSARKIILRVVDLLQTTPAWPCWASSWSFWGRANRPSSSVWPYTPCCPLYEIPASA